MAGVVKKAWIVLAAAGVLTAGHGLWLPTKAVLAQGLLEVSWHRAAPGRAAPGQPAPPWPWADTHPVARLRAPTHNIDHIVLDGSSGHVLAFAPGRDPASQHGHTIIAGHRDTHFAFLEHVKPGDPLVLELPDGTEQYFRVSWTVIVDHRDVDVLDTEADALTLITCWPFNAVVPGGPLRWVVRAHRSEPRIARHHLVAGSKCSKSSSSRSLLHYRLCQQLIDTGGRRV